MISRRSLLGSALVGSALTLKGSSLIHAQTPSPGDPSDPELWSYLSLSPTSIASLDQAIPFLAGNAQLQAYALNIQLPLDIANDDQVRAWIGGMRYVALPSLLLTNALRSDFSQLTGFDVRQISSGAEIGEPPRMVTFLRGAFDINAVQATQAGLGYQKLDIAGHPVYSLSPDASIDISNPVQQMALARLNNSTALGDGTLVYASTLDLIETVLFPDQVLADLPEVQRAVNTLDAPLITSALLGPGAFLANPATSLLERPVSQDQIADFILAMREQVSMPPVITAIIGSTPGGPIELEENADVLKAGLQPRSLAKFALVYASAEEAEHAALMIDQKLTNGTAVTTREPWTSIFTSWSAVPNVDQSSVLLTIEWSEGPARPLELVFKRDLGFIEPSLIGRA